MHRAISSSSSSSTWAAVCSVRAAPPPPSLHHIHAPDPAHVTVQSRLRQLPTQAGGRQCLRGRA